MIRASKCPSLALQARGQITKKSLKSNQNPYIEKEWPKEKVQKDKQRSTKHTHKSKDRVTRTHPTKTGDELECSGRVAVPAPLVAPVGLI